MTVTDILNLSAEQADASQLMWSFYITVSLGMVAYVAATEKTGSIGFVRLMLALGFVTFALVNYTRLEALRDQRTKFSNLSVGILERKGPEESLTRKEVEALKKIVKANDPGTCSQLVGFHLTTDLIVLGVIWFVPGIMRTSRRIKEFAAGEVGKAQSPFAPVKLSRNQQTGEWNLEEEYKLAFGHWRFKIPAGFKFDLASVPKPLWWIVAPFELSVSAPLIHDFAYVNNGHGPGGSITDDEGRDLILTRSETDVMFRDIMSREGVSWWRRTAAFIAVSIFGGLFWGSERKGAEESGPRNE